MIVKLGINFEEPIFLMAFLSKPGEYQEDSYTYEFSGDEDDRLRQESEEYNRL